MNLKNVGANQTILEQSGNEFFFSYNTITAARVLGKYYRTAQHYSATTTKHLNRYLSGKQFETRPQSFFDDLIK